jgi:hypothetical protein
MEYKARTPHRPQGEIGPSIETKVEERIRQRAHEIYLQRGGKDGSAMEDWLRAEQEILGAGAEQNGVPTLRRS